MAMPRRRIETPMVMMMRVMTDDPRAGRMVERSTSAPRRVTAATATRMATGMGRPRVVEQVMAMRAPYVTNSPWAKLTMPVALWIRVKPRAIMP